MIERTLSMIKPDAVQKRVMGEILRRFEAAGLRIAAVKMLHLSPDTAARFYAVHRERPFYQDLVRFMSSGPVLVMVLEGENAIARNREIMGPTDSRKAPPGTIRGDFGTDVEKNAVHGSDGPDTARWEIGFFFAESEIH